MSTLATGIGRVVVVSCVLAGFAVGTLLPASADAVVAQLALRHPVQVFSDDTSVTGVRLNLLLGVNQDVTGLDLGIGANRTVGDQVGFQFAPYNEVSGDLTGAELGIIFSDIEGEMVGLQLTVVGNYARGGTGAQISGLYNRTETLRGLQLGLINVAEEMEGLQLGLLNFNKKGFLPFFPLFNYGYTR
jgi:hypothetical protein